MLLQSIQNTDTNDPAASTVDFTSIYNNIHTILYFVDRNNPLGGYRPNPRADQAFDNWEYEVQKWKEQTYGSILNTLQSTSTKR